MNRTRSARLLGVAWVLVVAGCGSSEESESPTAQAAAKVGAACIPFWEMCPEESGAVEQGARLDVDNPMCGGGACIANHFRGRVTCPMGNAAGGSLYTGEDKDCYVPGTQAKVTAAVEPQCRDRRNNVYCTCQCGGSNKGQEYCKCPAGFVCGRPTEPLDPNLLPAGDLYCVRDGNDERQDGTTCCPVSNPACSDRCDTGDMCGQTDNVPGISGTAPASLKCEVTVP